MTRVKRLIDTIWAMTIVTEVATHARQCYILLHACTKLLDSPSQCVVSVSVYILRCSDHRGNTPAGPGTRKQTRRRVRSETAVHIVMPDQYSSLQRGGSPMLQSHQITHRAWSRPASLDSCLFDPMWKFTRRIIILWRGAYQSYK